MVVPAPQSGMGSILRAPITLHLIGVTVLALTLPSSATSPVTRTRASRVAIGAIEGDRRLTLRSGKRVWTAEIRPGAVLMRDGRQVQAQDFSAGDEVIFTHYRDDQERIVRFTPKMT